MKDVIFSLGALSAAFLASCSSDSGFSCDAATFEPSCRNETQVNICTHDETAIEECVDGFVCDKRKEIIANPDFDPNDPENREPQTLTKERYGCVRKVSNSED